MNGADHIVGHGGVDGYAVFPFAVPQGIIIPGEYVADILEFIIVQAAVKFHHVGGHGDIGAYFPRECLP